MQIYRNATKKMKPSEIFFVDLASDVYSTFRSYDDDVFFASLPMKCVVFRVKSDKMLNQLTMAGVCAIEVAERNTWSEESIFFYFP